LPQCFRHARAILIAVHHRNIGADKTKGTPSDYEAATAGPHERLWPRSGRGLAMLSKKEKGRAHNKCERGDQKKFFYHQ
jgi:hypothetical protein